MKISPWISYQRYDDFFIVLDHRCGREYRLNASGGTIIENIDQGKKTEIENNSKFIQSLKNVGIVLGDPNEFPALNKKPEKTGGLSVFDELVIYAAEKIIPVSVIMELTYRCPLNCIHCYVDRSEVPEKNELSKTDYFKFIDDFRKLGGLYTVLTGGDPILHKDFESIFNYLRSKRIAVSIMSSGFNSDYNLFKRIAEKGISTFQVSIYGHTSKIHDNFTGVKGSFDSAVKTLRFMKNLGVSVQAAISVNRSNIKFFRHILNFLEKEQIAVAMNYEMFPKRNGDTSPVRLNITEDELYECMKLVNRDPGARLKNKGPDDFPCNAARSLFSLNPAGNVFPCLEVRKKAGNIKRQDLSEIWNHSEILDEIRNIKIKNLKGCLQCDDIKFCNRCHGSALKSGLEITDHSNFDCIYANLSRKLI